MIISPSNYAFLAKYFVYYHSSLLFNKKFFETPNKPLSLPILYPSHFPFLLFLFFTSSFIFLSIIQFKSPFLPIFHHSFRYILPSSFFLSIIQSKSSFLPIFHHSFDIYFLPHFPFQLFNPNHPSFQYSITPLIYTSSLIFPFNYFFYSQGLNFEKNWIQFT